MKKNIAVFISGNGSNLQAIINESRKFKKFNVSLVISSKPDCFGLTRAKKHNIPSFFISKSDSKKIFFLLKQHNIDLIVLAGYLSIIDGDLIKEFSNKIINIHPSLIPSFCGHGMYGIKVHEAVIKSGVKISGCTTHFVNNGIDEGAIIMQKSVPVFFEDTPETLQKRILKYEHLILIKSINLIINNMVKIIDNKVKILK